MNDVMRNGPERRDVFVEGGCRVRRWLSVNKTLQMLIALTVIWMVVTMTVLCCRTPFGSWSNWQYLYQSAWDSMAGSCFYLAVSLWFMGFYEWWKLERQHLKWRGLLIAVVPAALFFLGGIGKVIADAVWCVVDGHTCHIREFVDGEIEKTVVNVGLCAFGSAWALVTLVRQYVSKPAVRKQFGSFLFCWAMPMTLLLIGSFIAYYVAMRLDDCMGEGWKYAFLDAYDWVILLMIHWVTLAVYWVRWIKAESGFWKPIFRRPILLLWTLIVSSNAYTFLERLFR